MLESGRILSGKYRLEAEIGRGGMGAVWRATRLDLGTSLAVKVMHGQPSDIPLGLDRFAREARAAASLSSPHVVRIIDFGLDGHTPFIAMELLEGESLAQRLGAGRALPPALVSRVITQVARALSEAHAAGIIHRDLKPANIFLVRNGDEELAKLLDFGVAKAAGGVATATGNVMGTPYYMSPEQVNSLKGIDHRSDLWSLGVIASECLTGSRPFTAETLPELAMRISLGRAPVPSTLASVPAGFDAWFARAICVDPRGRFQSATELALALAALLENGSVEAAAPASNGLAFASTQRLESMGSALPLEPVTPLVATLTAERAHEALSTTAPGSALSASRRPASRRWSLPFGAAAALALVIGVGYSYLTAGRGSAPDAVEQAAPLRAGSGALGTPLDVRAPSAGASFGGASPANADPEPPAADPAPPAAASPASDGRSERATAASARSRSAQSTTTRAARRMASPAQARPPVGSTVVVAPEARARPKPPPQAPAVEVQPSDRLEAYDTP